MKVVIILAFVAFTAAVPLWGGYQQKNIWIDENGRIWVTSQGWKVMVHRPMEHVGHVEVVASGDDGYHRQVVIDHQLHIVKDSYLGQEYQHPSYAQASWWGRYLGGFDQMQHLHSIFKQYVGPVEQQAWHEVLNSLLNEVYQGKVHYVIHEILTHFDQHHMGAQDQLHQHQWPNYDWINNQQYQSLEEHIEHARNMYQLAQHSLALFEQYGPEHFQWGQGFNHEQHLQYFKDLLNIAQIHLQYLMALQQNPDYVQYGIHNPWYGKNFGQHSYENQWAGSQYQGPWNTQYYGVDSQYQYVQNRIHYIRWQLIHFHHKSQQIFHEQQMITSQIIQLQARSQNQGAYNSQWVDQLHQLYNHLGMLVQQQVTLQIWIQQMHHDLDAQVRHWKQVVPHHQYDAEVYPEHQSHQPESHQSWHEQGSWYGSPSTSGSPYQSESHQSWYGQGSLYGSPSTWGSSYQSYQPESHQPWYGQGSWYGSPSSWRSSYQPSWYSQKSWYGFPSTWGKSSWNKWNDWWAQ